MDVLFNFVNEKLALFAIGNKLYYLSLGIFIGELVFGCLYLLWLSTFDGLKKVGVRFMYLLYQTCFFIDLGVSLAENYYVGRYYPTPTFAYFASLAKFVLLIALYGLVCAHRAILNLREKDKRKVEFIKMNDELEEFAYSNATARGRVKGNSQSALECLRASSDCEIDEFLPLKEGYKIADVNVAYVKAVIEGLKNKQIDQDDRERLNKIEFELKTVPVCENQKIRQLNDDFQFLIKKMTEYDVTV
ncbi:MAG: hypothetical protein IJA15_02940 [Clostridia bacterium]|nr:hypothetical protein [Clostridia bacterium]